MEKFKRHADAATGVNPFVTTEQPGAVSVGLQCLLFPFRMLVAAVLAVVILILEMPLHAMRKIGLGAVAAVVLHPVLALLVRLQLLAACNMLVLSKPFPPRPSASVCGSGPSARDDAQGSPRPGEVVVCNMQSPLDLLAIMSLGVAGGWSMPTCLVAFPLPDGTTMEMKPSPFQKLKVLRHVLWTGAEAFFRIAEQRSQRGGDGALRIDVALLQQRARRMRCPLLYFAEGTCGNGRGLLAFPTFACEGPLHLVALHYSSQQVHTVTKDRAMGGSKFLFRIGAGVRGLFGFQTCTALLLRSSGVPAADATYSDAWANALRSKLCAALTAQDSRSGCKPVASGFAQKGAFVRHWWEVQGGARAVAAAGP